MKKYLPKSVNNPQGFTLIELMVVIAIIAILSVIGFGIYNGAQGSARDSVRLTQINQLAKNVESTRDPSSGAYQYTGIQYNADYPAAGGGLNRPAGSAPYCIAFGAAAVTKPTSWPANLTACPTAAAEGTTMTDVTTVSASGAYFMVCTKAERGAILCRSQFLK